VAEINQFWGTGRRKTSVARVRLIPGGSGMEINGKSVEEYFGGRNIFATIAQQALVLTETTDKFKVFVNVNGGGKQVKLELLDTVCQEH